MPDRFSASVSHIRSNDRPFSPQTGEYELLELKHRVAEKPLPKVGVVDLREELKAGNRSILSVRLQELMEDRLKKGQQMMLFINRRGVAGFVSCRACGHVLKCPHCDVSLSQHVTRQHPEGKMLVPRSVHIHAEHPRLWETFLDDHLNLLRTRLKSADIPQMSALRCVFKPACDETAPGGENGLSLLRI